MTTEARSSSPIVIAYHHRLVREAFVQLLKQLGLEVQGEAANAQELLSLSRRSRPGLVLLEWELPDGGQDLIESLAALSPKPAVVVLAKPGIKEQLSTALQAGARGFLSLDMPSSEFEQSLQLLLRGDLVVSGDIADDLSGALAGDGHLTDGVHALSEREREVLTLVGTGHTNREIAETLIVTENTVKVHLRNVLDKLNLRNRQQAAAFAAREGLTESERESHEPEPSPDLQRF